MKNYLMILSELLICLSLLTGIVRKKEENRKEEVLSILIDPGHGGNDNGAVINDIYEDDINLDIALRLYEKCVSNNYIVYLTRNGDYDLSSEYSKNHKNEDLRKRVDMVNSLNIDLLISIHLNTYRDAEVNGPMVYYKSNDETSYKFAVKVQDNLNKLTNNKKNVTEGDYYLLNKTKIPGILVECGFLTNPKERKLLLNDVYKNAISDAIFTGIKNKLK